MEIITRTERRRKWGEADRSRILAECEVPGVTVRQVAERNDIHESVIYGWRTAKRTKQAEATELPSFIGYGEIVEAPQDRDPEHAPAIALPVPPSKSMVGAKPSPTLQAAHDLLRPHPGSRPGSIDITLASGERLTVDSYVNEKALNRVLRALKGLP